MNIAQNLEHTARLFGAHTALIFEDRSYSYSELENQAGRLAAALQKLGIRRGDRVALFLPNIPAFALAYYATQKLGAIAVSINSRSTESESRFVLEDCSAKVVFTTAEMRPNVPSSVLVYLQHIIICEGNAGFDLSLDTLIAESSHSLKAVELQKDDAAVILYTSGTTGTPKGATLSNGNIISNVWSFVHNCGMDPDDKILIPLPLFHCFGQNALLNSGLTAGSTLVLQRAFRPDTVLQAIEEEGITMFYGVPTMFLTLIDRATPEMMQSVRYYFSAAAKLPEEIERRWSEKFKSPVTQGYGLTETSPFASYNSFLQHRHGSIGTPIENVEMKIVDVSTGMDLPEGELGEIVIKGPNVMLGYWNRPLESAQVLKNGWFHSGDIGKMDTDGYFYIADRLKDMIDVGGMNVYPVQIENVLYEQGNVAEAAVFGIPDDLMGEQVWASVVLKPGVSVSVEDLLSFCREKLADFKVPRVLEIVGELPKNPAGKILKRVLRAKATENRSTPESKFSISYFAADVDHRRTMLVDLLAVELARTLDLPVESIEPSEALTDLGLESLMAVDLSSRLRSMLGVEFSVMVLVNGASLNSLTEALTKAMEDSRLKGK